MSCHLLIPSHVANGILHNFFISNLELVTYGLLRMLAQLWT